MKFDCRNEGCNNQGTAKDMKEIAEMNKLCPKCNSENVSNSLRKKKPKKKIYYK
jgi:hypothetical protein